MPQRYIYIINNTTYNNVREICKALKLSRKDFTIMCHTNEITRQPRPAMTKKERNKLYYNKHKETVKEKARNKYKSLSQKNNTK